MLLFPIGATVEISAVTDPVSMTVVDSLVLPEEAMTVEVSPVAVPVEPMVTVGMAVAPLAVFAIIVEVSPVPVPVIPTDVNVVVEPVFSVNVTNVEV
jgi:hypothetical protein